MDGVWKGRITFQGAGARNMRGLQGGKEYRFGLKIGDGSVLPQNINLTENPDVN